MAKILLTNDDGIEAPGLRALAEALRREHDLAVLAPAEPRSGAGHAVTLHREVTLRPVDWPGLRAFALDGTPADCVKLALTTLFPDRELVVSGINLGPNVGINVLYSGTVAAALEAAIQGRPGLALSVEYPPGAAGPDYGGPARFLAGLLRSLPSGDLPPALNLNFPARRPWKGLRWTRQGLSGFREYYLEAGGDGRSRRFRVDGDYDVAEEEAEYDARALAEGFVSVTPLGLDLTCRRGRPGDHRPLLEAAEEALRAALEE